MGGRRPLGKKVGGSKKMLRGRSKRTKQTLFVVLNQSRSQTSGILPQTPRRSIFCLWPSEVDSYFISVEKVLQTFVDYSTCCACWSLDASRMTTAAQWWSFS